MRRSLPLLLPFLLVLFCSFTLLFRKERPVLYLIGDSTVRNGDGTGKNQQWGWGSFMDSYFDTARISVRNHAIGGRSSRTFITEGRWDRILTELKKGDYVLIQFGHNDAGPLDDTARARGTIPGIGSESREIYNPILKKNEVVYTYGWYLRRYIQDVKKREAIPIVCSPVPRNNWKEGKVVRSDESYGKWAREVAGAEGACFINLNHRIAERCEAMGPEAVKAFFPVDHTHTDKAGAQLNAEVVMAELKQIKPGKLKKYWRK